MTDDAKLKQQLHSLIVESSRSDTARLRDIFDMVEEALSRGVSRAEILSRLNQNGFSMTMRSFDSALLRLRKERAGKEHSARSESTQHNEAAGHQQADNSTHKVPELSDVLDPAKREAQADKFFSKGATNPLLNRDKKDKQ